ncbi:hypothetical protein quinque_004354 [Culex quinquefasciatus]|uniref:Uncharacterized protein n=1 Tax=Culex pipiens pipiens TaxID=38569 RepID=A0ABD1D6T2_CULPP|nr:uncharacterized protein LOC120415799 [Culex pipiens pallens]
MPRKLSIVVLLLLAISLAHGYDRNVPRTYNLESEEDRYGRYERVLLGLKTSEGLTVDAKLLDKVREVIFEEESQQPMKHGERLVAVHLGRPKQSREVANLQYKNRIRY